VEEDLEPTVTVVAAQFVHPAEDRPAEEHQCACRPDDDRQTEVATGHPSDADHTIQWSLNAAILLGFAPGTAVGTPAGSIAGETIPSQIAHVGRR